MNRIRYFETLKLLKLYTNDGESAGLNYAIIHSTLTNVICGGIVKSYLRPEMCNANFIREGKILTREKFFFPK